MPSAGNDRVASWPVLGTAERDNTGQCGGNSRQDRPAGAEHGPRITCPHRGQPRHLEGVSDETSSRPGELTRHRSPALSLSRRNWVSASRLNLAWATSVHGHKWANGCPTGSTARRLWRGTSSMSGVCSRSQPATHPRTGDRANEGCKLGVARGQPARADFIGPVTSSRVGRWLGTTAHPTHRRCPNP